MGEVYRADDLELGQSVALKFLPERLAADPAALSRLRDEVRTARQVAHPNVCRVYDIAQADGHVFLSMEYVDGDDLSHVLRRLGPPSKEKALQIARQLCLGLAAAHDKSVLHRDLKPANVMLDGRGHVRITDFGLAGFSDELELNPQLAGTPAYMAPEQLASGATSVQSDLYSLGLLLYELFTGRPAFAGETLEEMRRSRSSGSMPSMPPNGESFDPAVERVILRCLEPDPADRPPSAYAVLAGLPGGDPLAAAMAAGETPSPDLVASVRERGGLSPRWALALFAGVILLLTTSAGVEPLLKIAPHHGPDELGVMARGMLTDLGHDIPRNQASDMLGNDRFRALLSERGGARPDDGGAAWPPLYLFWLRASPDSLTPDTIHNLTTRLGEPPATRPGSIRIVLGSGGRLVELEAVPRARPAGPGSEPRAADWPRVLRHAGLEMDAVKPTAPVRDVPPYCDEAVAYRVAGEGLPGGPYVFQACAHRGTIVHATTAWDWDGGGVLAVADLDAIPARRSALQWFWATVIVLSALIAWFNIRRGRGDRRGAMVYGIVVFAAYMCYDLTTVRVSELGLGGSLDRLLFGPPIGHAAMHGIHTALFYLAIEPYVRKIWPRALIGWTRLVRGRWTDPAVAREVLVGMFAAATAGALFSAAAGLATALSGRAFVAFPATPEVLGDTLRLAGMIPHSVAGALFLTMAIYFVLLVFRLLTGRDWATVVLALGLLAPLVFFNFGRGATGEMLSFDAALVAAASIVLVTIMIAMLLRFGLIAGFIVWFVGALSRHVPLTLDVSAFYAPQALLGMLVLVAVAAYGFRYSLAGQSLFPDAL